MSTPAETVTVTRAPYREPLIREDYELDLGAFFRVLLRYSWFIALCLVAALLAGTAYALLQPRTYGALAKVLIQRPKVQVTLDPRFVTAGDFELRPFFTQAKHPDVERAVQAQLAGELSGPERAPGGLIERLKVQNAREDPALMEIYFSDADPRRASLVVNAWTQAYIAHAQSALNPTAVAKGLVDVQLKEVSADLQRRDDAVREFTQRTGVGLPTRDDGTRFELAAPTGQNAASAPAMNRLGSRGREVASKAQTIAEFRKSRDQLRLLLAQARALRGAGTGLGSIAAEIAPFGLAANAPPEQAIAVLEARDRALGETIDASAAELKTIEAALAADVAQLERLERERDVVRDAYFTLAKKNEENKLGLATEWPSVQLFDKAPDLAGVDPRPWPLILGSSGSAGLFVGLIGAFLLHRRSTRAPEPSRRFQPLADRV